jgi:hypothetical protein
MSLTGFQWSAMLAGGFFGLQGVVAGVVVANFAFVGVIIWITRRLVPVRYADLTRAMLPGSLVSIGVVCVWLPLQLLGLDALSALAVLLALSAIIALAVLWTFQPRLCRKFWDRLVSVLSRQ